MANTRAGRTHYLQQLREVRGEILMMGSMVAKAIERSVEALKNRDVSLAEQVVESDQAIDRKQYEIEDQTLTIIATQQPMASDLRGLAAALFIVGELERMGDYAEGIAKIAVAAAEQQPLKPLIDVPRMATLAVAMLHRSLEGFIEGDLEICEEVWQQDDEVDGLYQQVYRELLSYMLESPATIERATQFLWVAHNLERIADRATNIAERTAFVVSGDPRTLPMSRDSQ